MESHPRFELAAPVPLNLVCLRHVDGDDATQAVLDAANATGRLFVTHTRLDGRLAIRVSVGQTATERRHVVDAWDVISGCAP